MATTSSSNSMTPTSTLSSGSSTPTNNSNGNGGTGITDLFSATESPPLIVAFLAIGVFIVALSGIFGWRRLSQEVMGPPPSATNRRRKSILIGKKPVLCDLWADLRVPEPSTGGPLIDATGYYQWDHVLPMSASLTFPIEPQAPVDSILAADRMAGHRIPSGILRYFASAVRQYYLPVRPSQPPPPSTSSSLASPPPPPSQAIPLVPMASRSEGAEQLQLKALATPPRVLENALDEADWGDASSVQVAVIITMPTQQRPGYWSGRGTSGREVPLVSEGMPLELGEYCIGTMDVPWGEAG